MLELEITESALIQNVVNANKTISALQSLGVAAAHILRIANIDVQKVFSDGSQQAHRRAK